MKSSSLALVFALVLALVVAAVLVGCGDSGPAPKPPAAITKVDPSARAPQNQAPAPIPAASNPTATPRADAAAQKTSTAESDPKIVEVAGLVLPKPVTWQWQTPTIQFRALQYSVPSTGESAGAAEVVFSVFAAGDGGPIEMNVQRWVGQFRSEDGSEAVAKIEDRMVNGLPVKMIELAGRYQGMGQAAPRPGMMQLGAIIQAPGRTVFIRLVGPSTTVEAARADFESMVTGVRAGV